MLWHTIEGNAKLTHLLVFCYFVLFGRVCGYLIKKNLFAIFIDHFNILSSLTVLKYNSVMACTVLTDIVVVDYLKRQRIRFELNYVLWNFVYQCRVIVKTFIGMFSPVPSVTLLYNSADWLEREAWDMYGIKISMHPNLRRILTDYGFKGHPQRKDFPLTGYIEIAYDDSLRAIKSSYVETAQTFRFYRFDGP